MPGKQLPPPAQCRRCCRACPAKHPPPPGSAQVAASKTVHKTRRGTQLCTGRRSRLAYVDGQHTQGGGKANSLPHKGPAYLHVCMAYIHAGRHCVRGIRERCRLRVGAAAHQHL